MLHEILLALLGYTGDLIIDEREHHHISLPISDDPTFKLAPDISFLEPSQRDLIERIVTLGFYYRELDRFATKSRNLSWIRSANVSPLVTTSELSKAKNGKQSVYRRAIANGIVEILSVYRSAVLHIEQKLLSETVPILATVTQGLNKFFVLLPPLYELVLEIERDDIRGGQLLNLLHKRCHCGVPELQTCIQRLLWHGHQVLYNQLASWMVYGTLQDQYGEFFIRRQEDRDAEHGSSHSDILEKLARLSSDDTSLTDWHLGFHIFLDMLPEYIHMRVAESILFAGKAVRVLRNPSQAFRFQDTVYPQQMPRGFQRFQGFTGRFPFQKEPFVDQEKTEEELLPQAEADKIEAMLSDLKESSEFHKRSFEFAVDSIRTIAASHLWQLVVVRADLNGHLRALKDYFLLAKGDFFQLFLEESRQLMRLPPRQSTAEADLMVPFQLAAIKTIGEEDKYFSRVSLRMPLFGLTVKSSQGGLSKDGNLGGTSETTLDGWDGIALEYRVDWPLQLFFTQEVLAKYSRVFQYLLRLKRTQMELEKSWASVMHQDHTDFVEPNAFQAKFPAQVRFKIFTECFPLPERDFKAAIIDNYHGSRFNQLLTSAQVKALISLFRPLTSTAPTSYVPLPPLLNVSRPHSFPAHIMQERFHQPPASLPYPEYTYLSSVHHIPSSQLPDTRQKQVGAPPPPLHGRYELVASVQPPIEHTLVVQHPALPHNADSYYVPDANKPYLHEKSSLYSQHPYNRYSSELEMVPGDPVVECAHDYVIPQLPKEGENNIVPRADYVAEYHGQHLPTVTSHNSLHSHVLPQSYRQPLPDHPQAEPPVFHEPYYPVSTHENLSQVHTDPLQRLLPGSSEANVAVPSHFLFGGGAPTYH